MRRIAFLFLAGLVAACGAGEDDPAGETTTASESVPADTQESEDQPPPSDTQETTASALPQLEGDYAVEVSDIQVVDFAGWEEMTAGLEGDSLVVAGSGPPPNSSRHERPLEDPVSVTCSDAGCGWRDPIHGGVCPQMEPCEVQISAESEGPPFQAQMMALAMGEPAALVDCNNLDSPDEAWVVTDYSQKSISYSGMIEVNWGSCEEAAIVSYTVTLTQR